jgi:VWFA-related protein
MSDFTAHGPLSATKTTKVTKITNNYLIFVFFVFFVIFVTERAPSAVSPQEPQTQAQQRPVFRAGTHFVRVDAYPLQDGKIVEGLKPEDFEILEDGKRQAIESFDFVRFDTFTPDAERRDPQSQREGFDKAADPRYRVFVIYVDIAATKSPGAVVPNEDIMHIRRPLVNFLDRIMTGRDLYGFLTSRNSVKDLVLAQKTAVTSEQIFDLWRTKVIDRDEPDEVLDGCRLPPALIEEVKALRRIDQSYGTLEDLVVQLGSIRQERKSVILVSNVLTREKVSLKLLETIGGKMPKAGITTGGKIGIGNSDVYGAANDVGCLAEVQRLAGMDFDVRYRDLLRNARRENVSFYPVTPAGLQAPVTAADQDYVKRTTDDLISLAHETDGVAIVNTNDLNAGMRRIADDLAAYYVLGYYTTNTTFDGGVRRIDVKAKGKAIRARRQYRAPTQAEITAMANPPPAAPVADAGPPAVIGPPVAYRVSRAQPAEQMKLPEFVRADRIRVAWPVLAALDRREARLLDSAGKPLPIDLAVAEDQEGKRVTVELPLAPFGRGVYSIELTAASGAKTERRRLTFTMK